MSAYMQAATPNSCPQLVCKDFWQMTSVSQSFAGDDMLMPPERPLL
jgi:hypothetical protein